MSHSTQTASLTLTYTITEQPGTALPCTLSRCNYRTQPLTGIFQIIGTCSTTYKTHRLPQRAASFKSLYLKRPHTTSQHRFSLAALQIQP